LVGQHTRRRFDYDIIDQQFMHSSHVDRVLNNNSPDEVNGFEQNVSQMYARRGRGHVTEATTGMIQVVSPVASPVALTCTKATK
jgi:hypothetical protein